MKSDFREDRIREGFFLETTGLFVGESGNGLGIEGYWRSRGMPGLAGENGQSERIATFCRMQGSLLRRCNHYLGTGGRGTSEGLVAKSRGIRKPVTAEASEVSKMMGQHEGQRELLLLLLRNWIFRGIGSGRGFQIHTPSPSPAVRRPRNATGPDCRTLRRTTWSGLTVRFQPQSSRPVMACHGPQRSWLP